MGIFLSQGLSEVVRTGHWPFAAFRSSISSVEGKTLVTRLYQRLYERSILFLSGTLDKQGHRTVRTEVTVQERTLLVTGSLAMTGSCPLCGLDLGSPRGAELHGSFSGEHEAVHPHCQGSGRRNEMPLNKDLP